MKPKNKWAGWHYLSLKETVLPLGAEGIYCIGKIRDNDIIDLFYFGSTANLANRVCQHYKFLRDFHGFNGQVGSPRLYEFVVNWREMRVGDARRAERKFIKRWLKTGKRLVKLSAKAEEFYRKEPKVSLEGNYETEKES